MKALRGKLRAAALFALCAALTFALPAWAAATPDAASDIPGAANLLNNDALFYGYLLRRAGASNDAVLMSNAASLLEEPNRTTCEKLKAVVAEVASGERTSSVLRVTYPGFQKFWSAAELGVANIVEDGHITEDAKAALLNKMRACFVEIDEQAADNGFTKKSTERIVSALISDCPYEMYWFDGTQGYASDMAQEFFTFTAEWKKGEGYCIAPYVSEDGDTVELAYEFSMLVSADFGEGAEINPNLRARIDAALDRASSIVTKYAGKGDYEKLLGYATEICDLTDYDYPAAQNSETTPYGDPWQLISVFDGDDSTKVVCEGYAKAFKYLCDLSAFSSPKVECRLVSGALSGGTGGGQHMWNVVTMENGKNYLVDVTNSDNTRGASFLFLKGAAPDNADATRYTFYNDIIFLYDDQTVGLWGSEWLTLDTADYDPSEPSAPSASLRLGGYGLSVSGKAVSMDDLRGGAEIAVTKDDADADGNVTICLAAYSAEGRMEYAQLQELNLSQSSGTFQTQALPDGAAYARFIAVNADFVPLASAQTPD